MEKVIDLFATVLADHVTAGNDHDLPADFETVMYLSRRLDILPDVLARQLHYVSEHIKQDASA